MKRWYWSAVIATALMGAGPALADDPKKPAEKQGDEKKADAKKADSDDKRTPMEKFRSAKKEFDDAYKEYDKVFQTLRDEKMEKLRENKDFQSASEKVRTTQDLMYKLAGAAAKADPASKDGGEALFFVLRSSPPDANRDLFDLALEHYDGDEKFATVIHSMGYQDHSAAAEALFKHILNKAKAPLTISITKYALGKIQLTSKDAEVRRTGEAMLEDVTKNYRDAKIFKRPVADFAEGQLFEYRDLAIGKTVPDIDGEDTTGETFKLSDYRGKVILLDFWAHW